MTEIILSGFGGQGILTAGLILISVAAEEGKNVTWISSYGAEMRGGTASCNVVISDEEIGSPYPDLIDVLIAMNEHSFEKYYKDIKPNGLAIVDSSLVKVDQARGSNICSIPARWLAEDKLKSFVGNMVIIGAFAKITGFVSLRSMIEAAEHVIPINHKDINKEALRLGYGWVGV